MGFFSSKPEKVTVDTAQAAVDNAVIADSKAKAALRAQLEGAGRGEYVPGYTKALAEASAAAREAQRQYDELTSQP